MTSASSDDNQSKKVDTGGGAYIEGNASAGGDIVGRDKYIFGRHEDARYQRNLAVMVDQVRDFWVKGVLENSLYQNLLIDLGMEFRPEAVTHRPWDMVVQMPDQDAHQFPHGTNILDIFRKMGCRMLILGEPGSGKTTMMLELVKKMIECRTDLTEKIPVVFNLSSWAEKQRPLEEWLIEELSRNYSVSKKLGSSWVDNDDIALFLDGLDEVREDAREACAQAINTFRQENASVPMCVCCRRLEYESLSSHLNLAGAIFIQSLTPEQIHAYLDDIGKPVTGLHTTLNADVGLMEMAESPLMLAIMVMTYQGVEIDVLKQGDSVEQVRERLFGDYVEKMFKRQVRTRSDLYSPEDTIRWLSWLAYEMRKDNSTVLLIERLQPDWLSNRPAYRLSVGLIFGLIFGLSVWLFNSIETTERINIDLEWKTIRYRLIFGLSVGLIFGLSVGLIFGLIFGLSVWLIVVMIVGLIVGLIDSQPLTHTSKPNEGIFRSLYNGLIFGLSVGLIVGLIVGRNGGLSVGLSVGLIFGLILGPGIAVVKHVLIRIFGYRKGYMPWNYARFLDYATERIFLNKVGGSYIFIHRMLLDYFADLYEESKG